VTLAPVGTDATWRLSARSDEPGWMPIPVPAADDEAGRWVAEQTDAMRRAWGDAWSPAYDETVPALLVAALDRRRPDDVFAFQVWPTEAPVCIFVHAAAGGIAPGTRLPGPGDGVLYEADGLGTGIHVPIVESLGGTHVVGAEFIFVGEHRAVTVFVEPTLPEILAVLMPAVHAFVQSVTLTAPDGRRFRAEPPALLEAGAADSWVDTLTTP
jgi:hypothetical protein